jgi:broad specificity phosphatase PhoE
MYDLHYLSKRLTPLLTLADPQLTKLGEQQAHDAHAMWAAEIKAGIPIPGKFYCSPLTRAMRTNAITFGELTIGTTMIIEVYLPFNLLGFD